MGTAGTAYRFAGLSAVDFVDAKNGWAVGGGAFEGNVILKYCDGP